jgi:hypothetical protein
VRPRARVYAHGNGTNFFVLLQLPRPLALLVATVEVDGGA